MSEAAAIEGPTEEERLYGLVRQNLKRSFPYFAERCLRIKNKTEGGALTPFILNKAQNHILEKRQAQLDKRGYVRMMNLKGRQQGVSTLVQGLAYWKTTHNFGYNAYILTHHFDATQTLFDMAKRYWDHCPDDVRPQKSSDSNRKLVFGSLGSSYGVGTAGSSGVGRSMNNQFFHGSEVAFWENAYDHAKGALQTVLDQGTDTEIYLESTANGMGNYFHTQWMLAQQGETDFEAVFVPWFWQPEYTRPVDNSFKLTDLEVDLKQQFDLTEAQIHWRRYKVAELQEDDGLDGAVSFKQEYPCTWAEAFQMTGEQGLITANQVMRARKNIVTGHGAIVMGVDPSFGRGDRFGMAARKGRDMFGMQSWIGNEVDTLAKRKDVLLNAIELWKPEVVFIDQGGGEDLAETCRPFTKARLILVPFGGSARKKKRYFNKRAEMYGELAAWLANEEESVSIPDRDDLHADLCATLYTKDVDRRLKMIDKQAIKRKLGMSPDLADPAALTFARHVVSSGNRRNNPTVKGRI
jgi:hypothetical protein